MDAVFASPRILIVRLSAIGDVIHGMPVLNALRDHWPGAMLAWLAEGRCGDLLEGHPALDELIRVPRKWLKSPREVWRLRRRLRAYHFDITIDLQGLTKSAIAASLSGARRRIGYGGADGRELSRLLNNYLVDPTATHVVDRNLELLKPLGIVRPRPRFLVPLDTEAQKTARAFLNDSGLSKPFALINPGAGWPSKLWPTERFAEVARFLGKKRNLPSVVVWAGNEELHMAEQIVAQSGGCARLAPRTSLVELAALAHDARLFLGSDTGPMHLAAALETPTVALFGPMPHERNGPYGDGHIAIQKACLAGGSRQRRNANNDTMLAIEVDDVCAVCDRLLNGSNGVTNAA
ncbi:MAG: lipopolysaccharide heptosyltransferase I [Planctomycetales bacterium]|nr:lipopolysaccharide heptosyltransferase I [Planctomycetales bacterium]